ncbi:MAG: hypothetical protein JSS76_12755 [Bacteroidetes bacterium]|nr:hypothetical protein [Bacteroidota bacterium]
MRLSIILGVLMSVMLMSCSKTSTTDNTTAWVGVYTGNAGGTINKVLVSKVDNSTLKMELQVVSGSASFTYVTLYNVHINSSASASVNENGSIYGYTDTYHFTGGGSLSGNSLNLTGFGTSTANSGDVKYYNFTGTK